MDPDRKLVHGWEMTDTAASNLVHQSFASLLAVDPETARVTHASANAGEIIGHNPSEMLGADARDVLGAEFWHTVCNAANHPEFTTAAVPLPDFGPLAKTAEGRVFASGPLHVIELAPHLPSDFGSTDALGVVQMAMVMLARAQTTAALASALCNFLHRVTGYDHVVWWCARRPGTAAALPLAEAKRASRVSVTAPLASWSDIWQSDRADLQMRADVNARPVTLLAAPDAPAPLDLMPALCAMPAKTHQYPEDTVASLSLRITRRDQPAAVVELRSTRARRPSPSLIAAVKTLHPFLDVTLRALEQAE